MNGGAPHLLLDLRRPGLTAEAIDRLLGALRTPGAAHFGAVHLLLSVEDRARCEEQLESGWRVHSEPDPIEGANRAFEEAASSGVALLVSMGAGVPSDDALAAMQAAFERDPYFAFVLPRVAVLDQELVAKLDPSRGDPTLAAISRRALQELPELHLVPDHLAHAVLIAPRIVRDFEGLDADYETLWGALRDLMARARRVGFRCVVANRATVDVVASGSPREEARRDWPRLYARNPDVPSLDEAWKHSVLHEQESLLGRACSASDGLRKTLLLDLSDLGVTFNGTSEAVIGLLWGLKACRSDWRISLLVSPAAARFHGFEHHFPELDQVWPDPPGRYTAVLRPIQPWSLVQLERLHRLGLFVFVMMFDTILDEIHTGAPPGLDRVWSLLARSADGLLYISRFTRDRFRIRFPLHPSVEECVSHLSLHPGDYCPKPEPRQGDFIFVVGNDYPHKWMKPTVRDLVEAFPYQQFRALGYHAPEIPQLSGLESGATGQGAVDELYSGARLIVYPSQYEGFGFPVIRGLSHGKTVIARASALLDELASHYRGPGRLLAFDSSEDLVELVARALHELPVEPIPLGTALAPGAAPDGQVEIARRIMSFVERRVARPDASNWSRRQALFNAAALARAS